MNDVEVYGDLIEEFIRKMTSPEIGQFRLETSTFRIILERARSSRPSLIKFIIVENGNIVNNLRDESDSLGSLTTYLQSSMDFISSLIGEELANDIVVSNMTEYINGSVDQFKGRNDLVESMPEPFKTMILDNQEMEGKGYDHEEIIDLFQEVFQAYIQDIFRHTDPSPVKIRLVLLREEYNLMKGVELNNDNQIIINRRMWGQATSKDIKETLSAFFNSLIELSTFLMGKEEAARKATEIFKYYFNGKEPILESYDMMESILDGKLYRKISTGLGPLDSRMGGGIPKGASLLLVSPSGIERDIFINDMLKKAIKSGCSAMMVTSKEPPNSIRIMLRSKDFDPVEMERKNKFRIIDWYSWRGERIIGVERDGKALKSSKILSNLGIAINKGLRELEKSPNRIGIIHIIAPATNIFEFNQVYNFIQRLRAKFKDNDMSSIFLLETDALSKEMEYRLVDIFDGYLEIRKVSGEGEFKRDVMIHSLSGIDFDERPISFQIKDGMIIPEIKKEDTEPEPARILKKVKRKVKRKKKKSADDGVKGNVKSQTKVEPKKVRRIIRSTRKDKRKNFEPPELEGVDLGVQRVNIRSNLDNAIGSIDRILHEPVRKEKLMMKPKPVRKRIK